MNLSKTLLAAALSLGLSASAATFNVGDYDGCSSSTASIADAYLPITGDHYPFSYSQIIYTPNELNGLYTVDAQGITKAQINSLTFKLDNAAGGMHEGGFSGKVYIQNYDGTAFPLVSNKSQWITYDTTVSADFASDEYYYDTPEVIEITASFSTPLLYEGGSLLVTFVADCESMENIFGEGSLEHYVFNTSGHQSAATASYHALDNLEGDAANVSSWVPVLQLGYTPVTVASDVKPVLFENVAAALSRVTLADGVQYGETEANALSFSFDLVNAEENGLYTITLGNTEVGTITGTHGVVNFVSYPKTDLVLAVTPLAEGALGSSTTVTLADVEALFPNPVVEALSSASYSEYEVIGTTATVEGVAKFKFTTTAPVARMKGEGSVNQTRAVTSTVDLPACFADFHPAGAYNDYAANDGVISYYNNNLASGHVTRGEFEAPAKATITVKFSMDYPLISAATPSVATEVATEVTTKEGYSYTSINREYDNESGYSYNKSNISVDVDLDNITLEPEYPGHLTKVETAGYISFYAPAGHTIHIAFTPAAQPEYAIARAAEEGEGDETQPEINWVSTDSNVYHHNVEENGAGTLSVKTVDADGNNKEVQHYSVNEDGSTTGIEDIIATSGVTEYFDLAGRRIANPSAGIYIMRKDGKTAKVLVK